MKFHDLTEKLKPFTKRVVDTFQSALKQSIKSDTSNTPGKGSKYYAIRQLHIRTRLIAAFILLSSIPMLFTGITSYNLAKSSTKEKISGFSSQITDQVGKSLDYVISQAEGISTELMFSDIVQKSLVTDYENDILAKLDATRQINNLFNAKFTSFKYLKYVSIMSKDQSDFITYGSTDIPKEEIKSLVAASAERKGGITWTPKKNNLILSRSINSQSGISSIGTLVFIVDENALFEVFKDIDLGAGSQFFIIDKDNNIISATDTLSIGNKHNVEGLYNTLIEKEENQIDNFDIGLGKDKMLTSYAKLSGNHSWYLLTEVPYSYLNNGAISIRTNNFVVGIISIILAVIASLLIAASIANPLKHLMVHMEDAMNGDLTSLSNDKGLDEIGIVSAHYNKMIVNIRQLIAKVNTLAGTVQESSNNLLSLSDRSYQTSEQIATTIQQVAKGASEQAQEVSVSVSQMAQLSNRINVVEENMTETLSVVQEMKQLSEQSLQTVELLNKKAGQTNESSLKVATDINELNEQMKNIKKIIKVIVGIAEQTNLLSLNAAIEAARAGEAGRGFAVVADEVRKLADQSKEASININNIINTITKQTEATVKAVNLTTVTIKEQMESVSYTDRDFKTIYSSMDNISTMFTNMTTSIKEIIEYKEKVLESIENISAVSEESAATSEEVSASTEEQMAGTEELANFVRGLNTTATELAEASNKFVI